MSGVYARLRKQHKFEILKNAEDLQQRLIKYVMNSKHLHKKYRYNIGNDIVSTIGQIIEDLITANESFPDTEEHLRRRNEYQDKAILGCMFLENKLITMERCIRSVKPRSLQYIAGLLSNLRGSIRKWRNNSKCVNKCKEILDNG